MRLLALLQSINRADAAVEGKPSDAERVRLFQHAQVLDRIMALRNEFDLGPLAADGRAYERLLDEAKTIERLMGAYVLQPSTEQFVAMLYVLARSLTDANTDLAEFTENKLDESRVPPLDLFGPSNIMANELRARRSEPLALSEADSEWSAGKLMQLVHSLDDNKEREPLKRIIKFVDGAILTYEASPQDARSALLEALRENASTLDFLHTLSESSVWHSFSAGQLFHANSGFTEARLLYAQAQVCCVGQL